LTANPKQGETVDKATLPNHGSSPNIRATHACENNSNFWSPLEEEDIIH